MIVPWLASVTLAVVAMMAATMAVTAAQDGAPQEVVQKNPPVFRALSTAVTIDVSLASVPVQKT